MRILALRQNTTTEQQTFSFRHLRYKKNNVEIPYDKITCFESMAKKVAIYQTKTSRNYEVVTKLDSIETEVPGYFLRCHKSYLVNMNEIRKFDITTHMIELSSEDCVPISRRLYKQAKETYSNFLKENGEDIKLKMTKKSKSIDE